MKNLLTIGAICLCQSLFSQFTNAQLISDNIYGFEGSDMISADFNGDGVDDVMVVNNGLNYFLNDGTGNFSSQWFDHYDAGYFACELDIDNDGDLDVAYVGAGNIGWHENSGGIFGYQNLISTGGGYYPSIEAGNLNGDAYPDLIVANDNSNEVQIALNNGNGTFGALTSVYSGVDMLRNALAADINGDGIDDILFASQSTLDVSYLENNGSGSFLPEEIIYSAPDGLFWVDSYDVNNDGSLDVVAGVYEEVVGVGIKISWFENDGNGNLGNETVINSELSDLRDFEMVDLDNDDDLDIIGAGYDPFWIENIGEGFFSQHYDIDYGIDESWVVSSGDYNNNGYADISVSYSNFDMASAVWFDNDLYLAGCTDVGACNYLETALTDDGSCCFGVCGCTDEEASNYDPSADCDNDDCLYTITGRVFYDVNENIFLDGTDFFLPFQEVQIQPLGYTVFTDNNGQFFIENVPQGAYNLELFPMTDDYYATGPNPFFFEVTEGGASSLIRLGMHADGLVQGIDAFIYPITSSYPCDEYVHHYVCFRNEGTEILSGVVALEMDPLFQGYNEITNIDSVIDNTLYMSYSYLPPGDMICYGVELLTPTADDLGAFLTVDAHVTGVYDNEEVAIGQETSVVELTCAYDPNDKQVFPNGYAEPHYILEDTELEYLVRFQNTGNAPATDVIVSDTLDPNLDLSTFQLEANSHDVYVSLNLNNGAVDFIFENINLPDSVNNEELSHGFVSYTIRPLEGLAPETEINNTAHIYFDNNPPIVTNTTWSTIYECTDDLAFFEIPEDGCWCEEVVFENNQDYIESYYWSTNSNAYPDTSVTSSLTLFPCFIPASAIGINLIVENPICLAEHTLFLNDTNSLNPAPHIDDISWNPSICLGDTTEIFIITEDELLWEDFGSQVSNEVSPAFTTSYSFEIVTDMGCTSTDSINLTVFELPALDVTDGGVICSGEEFLLSAISEDFYEWENLGASQEQSVFPIETTSYLAISINDSGCISTEEVLVEVLQTPSLNVTENQDICEGDETTISASSDSDVIWEGLGEDDSQDVSPTETTTYTAIATNNAGCESTAELTVIVNPLPTAEFTEDGFELTAASGTAFQWYFNGEEIEGATDQSYTATENGDYSVEIWNEFDCSQVSDEVFVTVIGIDEQITFGMALYPNPITSSSTLYLDGTDVEVRLYSTDGRLIRDYGLVKQPELLIERGDLNAGNYILKVGSEEIRLLME